MASSKKIPIDPVALVSGVKANDTTVQAAEKVIATMELASFSKKDIADAKRMLADYKARNGIR